MALTFLLAKQVIQMLYKMVMFILGLKQTLPYQNDYFDAIQTHLHWDDLKASEVYRVMSPTLHF